MEVAGAASPRSARRRRGMMATNVQWPLPYQDVIRAELRCIGRSVGLLLGRHLHQPRERVGLRLRFADGTMARVYRETVAEREPRQPCTLVVAFRLRLVRGVGHTLFRWESLLNTPLFVGYPGFVSKLWLAHDDHDIYRGIYEWDGPRRAEYYARSLWRVLALGCAPASIHYWVLPEQRRDPLLATPHLLNVASPSRGNEWWRVVEVT